MDIDLVLPSTGERAFVQVKAKATQAVLDDYVARFEAAGMYQKMFFVCHSSVELRGPAGRGVHIWARADVAEAAVRAGLFDWLLAKAA